MRGCAIEFVSVFVRACVCEQERERDSQTDRQTHRQTDRKTERQSERALLTTKSISLPATVMYNSKHCIVIVLIKCLTSKCITIETELA